MTKEEVKQEHKQTEGDPMLKGAIRSRQLAAAPQPDDGRRRRPPTSCWSTRPTSRSPCATSRSTGAPRVVAKGAGAIAAKIRERAAEERVPMVEDVPLARALLLLAPRSARRSRRAVPRRRPVLAFVISRRTAGHRGRRAPLPAHRDATLPDVPRRRTPVAGCPQLLGPPPADRTRDARTGRTYGATDGAPTDQPHPRKAQSVPLKRLTQLGVPDRRRASSS